MGWKEPVHVEHSGSIASKFEQMSDDELRAFIERNDAGAGDIFAASQSFANTGKPN
jgi:hypothetical protein